MNPLKLTQWLRAVWNWLAEGKIAFMCVLVLIATLLLGMVVWRTEASIRIAGFSLQLIGMAFAVRGVLAVRAHFGHPLLRKLFISWIRRFPTWKRQTIIGVGTATSSEAAMSGRAEVWNPDYPEQSVEQRIEAIIKNLGRIKAEQSHLFQVVQELQGSHEKHRQLVAEKAKNIEDNLRSDLESLHTGDILVSLVGLIWLTIGISLSTLAPELAKWLYSS